MKPVFTYHFEDEQQFQSVADRAWLANYFRACRANKRYQVTRKHHGYYQVQLNYPGSPVAVIAHKR